MSITPDFLRLVKIKFQIMEYKIKTISNFRFFIIIMLFPLSLLLYTILYGSIKIDKNDNLGYVIFILIVICLLGLFWIAGRFFSNGEILIKIDNNGLSISWIKNFILSYKNDRFIKWSDIKSYEYKRANRFSDKVIIRTQLGDSFSFNHNDFDKHDDHGKFIVDFANFACQYNDYVHQNNIKKTEYQKTFLLFVVIIFIVFLVFYFIYKLI